jgi:hypothetical protein
MARVFVAALLAGAVVFVWGFVWWTVLPFSGWVMKPVPNEQAVSGVVKASLPESGHYFYPYAGDGATPEAQEAMLKQYQEGPSMTIIYHKEGMVPMSPTFFAVGYAQLVVSALLAAALLRLAAPSLRTYASRVGFVVLIGLFAAVVANLADIVWYHQPWKWPLMVAVFNASGWALAALVLGAVIRPARAASGSTPAGARNGATEHAAAARV